MDKKKPGALGVRHNKNNTADYEDKTSVFENARARSESAKAVLVEFSLDGEDVQHWIPKSQIDDESEVYGRGHRGRLVITKWMADKLRER